MFQIELKLNIFNIIFDIVKGTEINNRIIKFSGSYPNFLTNLNQIKYLHISLRLK